MFRGKLVGLTSIGVTWYFAQPTQCALIENFNGSTVHKTTYGTVYVLGQDDTNVTNVSKIVIIHTHRILMIKLHIDPIIKNLTI